MAGKALIFYGGWPGHQPEACSAWVTQLLEKEGFEVICKESTACLAEYGDSLKAFDLIVPVVTMSSIEKESSKALLEAILSGVGLAGFHGGMGDSFRGDPGFQYMVGGQFVCHPGNIIPYRVTFTPGQELTAGLEDFDTVTEQYFMHVDPGVRVLATTVFSGEHDPWVAGTVMPVAWTKAFGKGRVFYHSLGHAPEEWEHPIFRELTLRGMQWAARG